MEQYNSHFNRNLLIILAVLFVLSLTAFSYISYRAGGWSPEWWMFMLNVLILAVPLVLVFGSIYVLVTGWREHNTTGQVSLRLARIIHWAPRIAAIMISFSSVCFLWMCSRRRLLLLSCWVAFSCIISHPSLCSSCW